ncbi:PREDICTED: enoyl-CoA delta isomerase 1, mitochondrial-like [Dufourea novaeangliae]|uniref:Enoyl-CoA delta isomerase 1, mitochondrial n=1 Tax=Dufourea novaeangliae TaxID=178035 RepID=A0A154PLQ0_DUFNO|nr:PREDICTED: enoyl-CoA delta isomerase 1, mitochondrial-like [Dufourea novaeangliae]KZC12150.1 Enoyl-CoA delta isomerase 1, mitochondrial [Dufourea novaeangliae]
MFLVKRICNRIQVPLSKAYATNLKQIEVTHEESTGITTISMSRQPVNGLNKELLNALNTSLLDAQKNRSTGVILTSSLPSVFSAGLDIMEMYNRTESQMTEYWQTLQDTWLTLYSLEMPVAAAINGASPAGGCLLALSCEYRVFVEGNHTIGLNETQLGIPVPKWFKNLYIDVIGYRKAELACLRGSLFSPKEALKHGLVDELVAGKADAISRCQNYIKDFKYISPIGRSRTKLSLRELNLLWMKDNRNMDLNDFLSFIQSPKVQAGLKLYIESLKRK